MPLLVRQAWARVPIFYSDLAAELGIPNPRNLNYVRGSIGQCLERLSKVWKEKIPPIQCIVVNKATGLPGEGARSLISVRFDFSALPMHEKGEIVEAELQNVFSYPRWEEVLATLSLEQACADFSSAVSKASKRFGKEESESHRTLKEYVAKNPESIGLGASTPIGTTEDPLPSGDSLDVSFHGKRVRVAVDIKSAASQEADIARGLFQSAKYLAVMKAKIIAEERAQSTRVALRLSLLADSPPPARRA